MAIYVVALHELKISINLNRQLHILLVSKRSFMSKIIEKLEENQFQTVKKSNVKCPICNGDLYTTYNWMIQVMEIRYIIVKMLKNTNSGITHLKIKIFYI